MSSKFVIWSAYGLHESKSDIVHFMNKCFQILPLLIFLIGCSYSDEQKELIEIEQQEIKKLLQEIVSCSETEGNVYLNHDSYNLCTDEYMGGQIIKYNSDEITFDCKIYVDYSEEEKASCRVDAGIEIITSPLPEGVIGTKIRNQFQRGQCFDLKHDNAINKCEEFSKSRNSLYKNLDNLSDFEASKQLGWEVKQACAYSFDEALRPYTSDIKKGILRWTRLTSEESIALASKVRKKVGDIETGIYHCECILLDHLSKKDYAPKGLSSWQRSVGNRPGYFCSGPVYEKQ